MSFSESPLITVVRVAGAAAQIASQQQVVAPQPYIAESLVAQYHNIPLEGEHGGDALRQIRSMLSDNLGIVYPHTENSRPDNNAFTNRDRAVFGLVEEGLRTTGEITDEDNEVFQDLSSGTIFREDVPVFRRLLNARMTSESARLDLEDMLVAFMDPNLTGLDPAKSTFNVSLTDASGRTPSQILRAKAEEMGIPARTLARILNVRDLDAAHLQDLREIDLPVTRTYLNKHSEQSSPVAQPIGQLSFLDIPQADTPDDPGNTDEPVDLKIRTLAAENTIKTEQTAPQKTIAEHIREAARHETQQPAAPVTVTTFKTRLVQDGDTIESLAQEEGTTPEQIIADNPHIADPNLIRANRDIIRLATTTEETTDDTFDAELEAAFSPNNIDASEEVYTAVGERIQTILDSSDVGTMDLQVSISGDTMYVSFRMPSQNSERDDSSIVILNLGNGAGGTMTPDQMGALDNMLLGVQDLGLSLVATGIGAVAGLAVGLGARWQAEQVRDRIDYPAESTLPERYMEFSGPMRRDMRRHPIPDNKVDEFIETVAAIANAQSRDRAVSDTVVVVTSGEEVTGAFISRPDPHDGTAHISTQRGFYRLNADGQQVVQVVDEPQTRLRRSTQEIPVTPEPSLKSDPPAVPAIIIKVNRFGKPVVIDSDIAVPLGNTDYDRETGRYSPEEYRPGPEPRNLGAAVRSEYRYSPVMTRIYNETALILATTPEVVRVHVTLLSNRLEGNRGSALTVLDIYASLDGLEAVKRLEERYRNDQSPDAESVFAEIDGMRSELALLIFDQVITGNPNIDPSVLHYIRTEGLANRYLYMEQLRRDYGNIPLPELNRRLHESMHVERVERFIDAAANIHDRNPENLDIGPAFVFVAEALTHDVYYVGPRAEIDDPWSRVYHSIASHHGYEYADIMEQFILDNIGAIRQMGEQMGDSSQADANSLAVASQISYAWTDKINELYIREENLFQLPPPSNHGELKDGGSAINTADTVASGAAARLHLMPNEGVPVAERPLRTVLQAALEEAIARREQNPDMDEVHVAAGELVGQPTISEADVRSFLDQFDPAGLLQDLPWPQLVVSILNDPSLITTVVGTYGLGSMKPDFVWSLINRPEITIGQMDEMARERGEEFFANYSEMNYAKLAMRNLELEPTETEAAEEHTQEAIADFLDVLGVGHLVVGDEGMADPWALQLTGAVRGALTAEGDRSPYVTTITSLLEERPTHNPYDALRERARTIAESANPEGVQVPRFIDGMANTLEAFAYASIRTPSDEERAASVSTRLDATLTWYDTVDRSVVPEPEALRHLNSVFTDIQVEVRRSFAGVSEADPGRASRSPAMRVDIEAATVFAIADRVGNMVMEHQRMQGRDVRRVELALDTNLPEAMTQNPTADPTELGDIADRYMVRDFSRAFHFAHHGMEYGKPGSNHLIELQAFVQALGDAYGMTPEQYAELNEYGEQLLANWTSAEDAATLFIDRASAFIPESQNEEGEEGNEGYSHMQIVTPETAKWISENPRSYGTRGVRPGMTLGSPIETQKPPQVLITPDPAEQQAVQHVGNTATTDTENLVNGTPPTPDPAVEPGASVLAAETPDDEKIKPGEAWADRWETDLSDLTKEEMEMLREAHPLFPKKDRLTRKQALSVLASAREAAAATAEQAQQAATLPTDTPTAAPIETNVTAPGLVPENATWWGSRSQYGINGLEAEILKRVLPLKTGQPWYTPEQVAEALANSVAEPVPPAPQTVPVPHATVEADVQHAPVTPPPVVEAVVTPTPEQQAAEAAQAASIAAARAAADEQEVQRVAAEEAARVTAANQLALEQQAAEAEAARIEAARVEAERVAQTPPAVEAPPTTVAPVPPAPPIDPGELPTSLESIGFDYNKARELIRLGGLPSSVMTVNQTEQARALGEQMLTNAGYYGSASETTETTTFYQAPEPALQPESAPVEAAVPPTPAPAPATTEASDPPADVAINHTAEGDEVLEYLTEQERLDRNIQVTVDAARRETEHRAAQVRQFEGIRDAISAAGSITDSQIDAIVRQGREMGGGVADLAEALAENRLARNAGQAAGVVLAIIAFLVSTEGA